MKKFNSIILVLALFLSNIGFAAQLLPSTTAIRTVTTTATVVQSDQVIAANAAGSAFAVNLPLAADFKGRSAFIKKTDTSTNIVTVTATGGQLIDGVSTYQLSSQNAFVEVLSTGSAWLIKNKSSNGALVGSAYILGTASCQWIRTNTVIGAFPTDADCPGPTVEFQKIGTWLTTDTDLPQFTINDLPPGIYRASISLLGASAGEWTFAITDGTTTTGHASGSGNGAGNFEGPVFLDGVFEYSVSGNRTFSIHGATSSGNVDIFNQITTPPRRVIFSLYRY